MSAARRAAWRALVAIEKGRAARLVLPSLPPGEHDLALELARGVERQRLLLDHVLQDSVRDRVPADPMVRTALRLGAYQLLFLSRIPPHAAVAESVALLPREKGFGNAVLRAIAGRVVDRDADPAKPRDELPLPGSRAFSLSKARLPDPALDRAGWLGLRHALPRFVVARWIATFGVAAAERAAQASARTPVVMLRPNRFVADVTALAQRLADEGVVTEQHDALLRWSGGASPFSTASWHEGWFVAQDPTAVAAAEAVGAEPGERILDLCAGPGTKATLLAACVAPDGRVAAYDVDERRRAPIRANAERLRLTATLGVHDDLDGLDGFDRALVDAPCSNTGVLARRVEVRRRLRPDAFVTMATMQQNLLREALQRVRPGGVVVYAVCSIEPEETREVVETAAAAGHRLVLEHLTLPSAFADGGYHAVLQRCGEPERQA